MPSLEEFLAADIESSLGRYRDGVLVRIRDEIPELFGQPELATLARSSTEALLRGFAVVLRIGQPREFHAPAQSLVFGQFLARADLPLAHVLRSYRLGHEVVFQRAADLARENHVEDGGVSVTRVAMTAFRFTDAVMTDVAAEFDQEREAILRRSFARREATVHALLAGASIDIGEAEKTLGYRLDGTHQAIVAWALDADAPRTDELATSVQSALGTARVGRPLLLATEQFVTAWISVRPGAAPPSDAVFAHLAGTTLRVAVGNPATGVAGFVRTKQQADLAHEIALLGSPRPITFYADVALTAVLTRDVAVAQAFAADELHALAAPTDGVAVLRATVAAYFASGHDQSRTARNLQLHRNTVARRLARAEALLGRGLSTRVRELEAALVIAEVLGTATHPGR